MILENFTIASLKEAYKNKKFTVTEVVQAYLDRINERNKLTNTYVLIADEFALKQVAAIWCTNGCER